MIPLPRTLRVVVADDEIDIREYLEVVLLRLGHKVVGLAENGHQLIALCQRERPDLIITDVTMPKMSGLEAAKIIAQTLTVTIIVVSSHEQRELGINPLIAEYLVKPFGMPELQSAIDRARPT
jgi:YesN/AraC family two-component response regulator